MGHWGVDEAHETNEADEAPRRTRPYNTHPGTWMTVAERTREAVRTHPFLYHALRAGVVNYSAAARFLDVDVDVDVGEGNDGGVEAVAVALRRYARDLPDPEPVSRRVRVDMQSGLETVDRPVDADGAPVLTVGGTGLVPGGGSITAIVATGEVGSGALLDALSRLQVEGVPVEAAAAGDGHLVVAVGRRDGPTALRVLEEAL